MRQDPEAPAGPRLFCEKPAILRRLRRPPSKGRGLWLFVMQQWRHKRKSRNALASPIYGGGGPRERWKGLAGTEKIRCVKADRPLAARTAMECHSGALPHTPFCHCVALPSRGNERIRQGRSKPEGLSRHWRRIKWRRKAPYPASAAILYNYPVPAGTQPVREASAGPGQNPGSSGP